MIFSIQRYLEDLFERRGLADVDQYAVKVANLYDSRRPIEPDEDLLRALHKIRTIFFRNNSEVNRIQFESDLLKLLDDRFKKKLTTEFPGGVTNERNQLSKRRRRNILSLLEVFCHAVEARAIDLFWKSRRRRELVHAPEKIGQGLLSVFIKGVLFEDAPGLLLREMQSGIGFVDIVIVLSSIPHLVEMKVITSILTGTNQLQTYMQTEQRREGWLVLFDARPSDNRASIPKSIDTDSGRIRLVTIDINPQLPSRR